MEKKEKRNGKKAKQVILSWVEEQKANKTPNVFDETVTINKEM